VVFSGKRSSPFANSSQGFAEDTRRSRGYAEEKPKKKSSVSPLLVGEILIERACNAGPPTVYSKNICEIQQFLLEEF
jgi:hypothetical protein